jgi:hypothetical protein
MIRRLMRVALGYHDLHGEMDFDALTRSAIRIESASELNTLRVGIFALQDGVGTRYYCRSRIGWVLRSLFYIRYRGDFELIPHPLRIASGAFCLLFLLIMNVVSVGLVISKLDDASFVAEVSAFAFILLLNTIFAIAGSLFLVVEKKLVLSGYKKYSAGER